MRIPIGIKFLGNKLFSKFPLLDCCFRRFIWSRVRFPEAEMRFLNAIQAGLIDVAVDVGAALGSYSWILNRVANEVFAFEPGNILYRCLNQIASYRTNIHVIHAAVGGVCGPVNFYTPGSGSSTLFLATLSQDNPVIKLADTRVDQVDQVTLDIFLTERLAPGRTVDVLKVDVEGYELEVFKGSIEILSKHHPLIICEIEARHNPNYGEVFGALRKLGYDCYIFRAGAFESFSGEGIEVLQLDGDMKIRLGDNFDPDSNRYVNNFVFQHPQSRIKVRR